VKFGGFELDAGARRLLGDGRDVHLSPKAFDLLQMLVVNRPDAVSKGSIQDALWPATHVVEANVANLVGEVRRALDDDPASPRFIRTVARFGYAFIHPVEEDDRGQQGRAGGFELPATFVLRLGGALHRLHAGVNVLGRSRRDDNPFRSDTVSRRHARIVVDADSATLEDLGSKNGTFVNGVRIAAAVPLRDGDVVRLGAVELVFCSDLTDGQTRSITRL
jgi:DNA-binding winged helix-turn-helix (wHTH) protein